VKLRENDIEFQTQEDLDTSRELRKEVLEIGKDEKAINNEYEEFLESAQHKVANSVIWG
jgi:hypothetical protein